MDKIRIKGGKKLSGSVEVSGSKNAALPILISSLLTTNICRYKRVPDLQDISSTLGILEHLGTKNSWDKTKKEVTIDPGPIAALSGPHDAPYDIVRKMRASVLVLGPLLARYGKAKVSLPGGCAIGARPINFHLSGFKTLGADILLEGGYVIASSKKLIGNRVSFEFPSVGATENVLMASALAKGESILENCAKEPEIYDLAQALIAMGAKIEGAGTETIRVQGVDDLQGVVHQILGDRIEAGTYLTAGLITGGNVEVHGIAPETLESVLIKFEEAGARVVRKKDSIAVDCSGRLTSVDVTTQPFPGFPTDMQAQFMVLMSIANGASAITETIFENRFMHVPELLRLGANITVKGHTALVRGVENLKGAPLMATDLRASASLVLGGLCAQGETMINRIYHLDRGYEHLEQKLAKLGAEIERLH